MNSLLLYDSTFGHTGQMALTIAGHLGEYGTVRLFRIHEVAALSLQEVDLMVIGYPAHQRDSSNAMQAFLERFSPATCQHLAVAAFETCDLGALVDVTAHSPVERLQSRGATLLLPPKRFMIELGERSISDQDRKAARQWAEQLHETFEALKV